MPALGLTRRPIADVGVARANDRFGLLTSRLFAGRRMGKNAPKADAHRGCGAARFVSRHTWQASIAAHSASKLGNFFLQRARVRCFRLLGTAVRCSGRAIALGCLSSPSGVTRLPQSAMTAAESVSRPDLLWVALQRYREIPLPQDVAAPRASARVAAPSERSADRSSV